MISVRDIATSRLSRCNGEQGSNFARIVQPHGHAAVVTAAILTLKAEFAAYSCRVCHGRSIVKAAAPIALSAHTGTADDVERPYRHS